MLRYVKKSPVAERKNNTSINLATLWKDKGNSDVLKFNENGISRQPLRVKSSSESCLEVSNKVMPANGNYVQKLHLLKENGKGLGIQVTDHKEGVKGIFISHILDDGAAAKFSHSSADLLTIKADRIAETSDMPDAIPAVPRDISKSFDGVCHAGLLQKTIIMGLIASLHDFGVDILSCYKGFNANRDGRLCVGDELLFVNGHSLISVHQQEAVTILRAATNPIQIVITRQGPDDARTSAEEKKRPRSVLSKDEERRNESPMLKHSCKREIKEVKLSNGKNGKRLGFSICGGKDKNGNSVGTFIKTILLDGIAAEEGTLKIGDEILEVNNISIKSMSHQNAVALFKSLKKGTVTLLVKSGQRIRRRSSSKQPPGVIDITITKIRGKGLGIGIGTFGTMGEKEYGIYVKYVAKGSSVAKQGNLWLKDQLLAINGLSLQNASLDEAYKILRSLKPGNVLLKIKRTSSSSKPTIDQDQKRISLSSQVESQKTFKDGQGGILPQSLLESGSQDITPRKSSLALLMSPAMPVHSLGLKRNESVQSAISLCDSNPSSDDNVSIDSTPSFLSPKSDVETVVEQKVNKNKDAWLNETNNSISQTFLTASNTENAILMFDGGTKYRSNSDVSQVMPVHDKVIVERRDKGSLGLGIKIVKGPIPGSVGGVFVKSVTAGGAAALATGSSQGGVRVGDQIVQVNEHILEKIPHVQIVTIFKSLPRKSVFVLKRKSALLNALQRRGSVLSLAAEFNSLKKHSVERTFSDESTSVPNMIEDQVSNQPVIERHSVLQESFNAIVKSSEVSEQPRESSSTLLTTRNLKAQSVLRTRLAGFPFPSPTEIPLDFDAYLVEFVKEENASIGLSLVPALSDRFLGFFQVRHVTPEGVLHRHKHVNKGDYIYSVNGLSMKDISHPKALQVLQQCRKNVRIVIYREKNIEWKNNKTDVPNKTIERTENEIDHSGRKTSSNIPGAIQVNHAIKKPPYMRRVTAGSCSSLKLPELSDECDSSVALEAEHRMERLSASLNSLVEETNDGAVLVEYERLIKGLGVSVMMDEHGDCYVTEVSPNGMVATDDKIKVGDNLLAINNNLLSGKPVSYVTELIRSIPRGKVEILVRSCPADLLAERKQSIQNSEITLCDSDSSVSTVTNAIDHRSNAATLALPLPIDTKSKVLTTRKLTPFQEVTPFIPPPDSFSESTNEIETNVPFNSQVKVENIVNNSGLASSSGHESEGQDDLSDVASLPAAPPRPRFPTSAASEVFSNEGLEFGGAPDEDSDLESMFSCIPAAPPPPKYRFKTESLLIENLSAKEMESDAESFFTSIPAPPPPVVTPEFLREREKESGSCSAFSTIPPPQLLDAEIITANSKIKNGSSEPKVKNSDQHFNNDAFNNNELRRERMSSVTKQLNEKLVVQNNFLKPISTRNSEVEQCLLKQTINDQIVEATVDSNLSCQNAIMDTKETNSKNSLTRSKDKKISLFSKLKSKIALPSKQDKSDVKKTLKPSISHPDLLQVSQFVSNMRKAESMNSEVFPKAMIPSIELTQWHSTSDVSQKQSSLPRILSFRKSPKEKVEKRKKGSRSGSRHSNSRNISPPATPPPPPPPEFEEAGSVSNQIYTEEVQTTKADSVNRTYEEIDSFVITSLDLNCATSAVSEGSSNNSQPPASYAAEGPTTFLSPKENRENTLTELRNYESVELFAGLEETKLTEKKRRKTPPNPPPRNGTPMQPKDDIFRDLKSDLYEDCPSNSKEKRSSLMSFNFPPPPTDEEENSMTLKSQKPPSSYDDSSGPSDLEIDGKEVNEVFYDEVNESLKDDKIVKERRHKSLDKDYRLSEFFEKDKADPKLQPFILTGDVDQYLQDLRNDSLDQSYDDDGWGSEFSSNIYDEPCRLSSSMSSFTNVKNLSVDTFFPLKPPLNSSLKITDTLKKSKKQLSSEGGKSTSPVTPKMKVKNFFSRKSSLDLPDTENNKKNRQHLSHTLPRKLEKQSALSISQPVLINRKSFVDIFSPDDLQRYGFPSAKRNSHQDLVDEIIQGKSTVKVPVSSMKPCHSESDLSKISSNSESVYATIPDLRQNPIPKPPRKGTIDPQQMALDAQAYANISFPSGSEYKTNVEQVKQNEDHTEVLLHDASYENLSYYTKSEHKSGNFREVPPIPVEEEEFLTNSTSLSQEELEQLYAKVDFSKKTSPRGKYLDSVPFSGNFDVMGKVEPAHEEKFSQTFGKTPPPKPHKIFREGVFKVEVLRESGKPLGFTIIGGKDTDIGKVLIESIQPNSVINSCTIPLKEGDEIIEINKEPLLDCAHTEILAMLKHSPPLVHLKLHRTADGNKIFIDEHKSSGKGLPAKLDTEHFLASVRDASHTPKHSDIVKINPTQRRPTAKPRLDRQSLSVETFEKLSSDKRIGRYENPASIIAKTESPEKTNAIATSRRSSVNTNVYFSNQMGEGQNTEKIEFEIDLYKEEGKGLGIAVTGGPKLVIEEGIKVKRLVSNSIAGNDGRLQRGDMIIAINERRLMGLTQGAALGLLKDIPKKIVLLVKRDNPHLQGESLNSDMITLKKNGEANHVDVLTSHVTSATPELPRASSRSSRRSRSERKTSANGNTSPVSRRSRSSSRLSRLFRGTSSESLDNIEKEKKPRKRSRSRNKNELFAVYFDKITDNKFDFTLSGGGDNMYGSCPIVIDTIVKGSELSRSLKPGDEIVKIQGLDMKTLSTLEVWDFLFNLPLGRICMLIQKH